MKRKLPILSVNDKNATMDLSTKVQVREDAIKFYEHYEGQNHIYIVDEKTVQQWDPRYKSKMRYVSTTTVIKGLFPQFDENKVIASLFERNVPGYSELSADDIKAKWKDIRDIASFRGTRMHAYFESILKREPLPYDLDTLPISDKNFVDRDGLTCKKACELLKKGLEDKSCPQKLKNFDVFKSEWRLFDEKHFICGTVDCVLVNPKNPRELIVVDWKRSKSIKKQDPFGEFGNTHITKNLSNCNFIHYSIQLNIYTRLIECMFDMKVSEMYIININSIKQECEIFPVQRLDALVTRIFDHSFKERLAKIPKNVDDV